jgi:hypothetical protein
VRAAALALATLFIFQWNLHATTAQSIIGVEFVFDIVPEFSTLTELPSTSSTLPDAGTTFYIEGTIYPFRAVNQATCEIRAGARALGTWRAWGSVARDGRLVLDQSLTIASVGGMIEVQGTTGNALGSGGATPAVLGTNREPFTGPTEVYSVTGGTGVYRSLNGEAHVRPYCQTADDITRPFRYDRAFCLGVIEGIRRNR